MQTAQHCTRHGVPHPRCYSPSEARELPAVTFPLFGKRRFGRGGVGAQKLEHPHQLADFLDRDPDGVIQELLSGDEFTVDVLVDDRDTLRAAVPKQRLEVKAGMATKSVTRAAPELARFAATVARLFGVRGIANVQVMVNGYDHRLIEVNPKFAASLPLTVAAGVNLPLCLLALARGELEGDIPLAFRTDLMMLRCWEEHFVDLAAAEAPTPSQRPE